MPVAGANGLPRPLARAGDVRFACYGVSFSCFTDRLVVPLFWFTGGV